MTVRQTIENSWADTFLSKPRLTHQIDVVVDALLRWFQCELNAGIDRVDQIDGLTELSPFEDRPAVHSATTRNLNEYRQSDTDWADRLLFRDLSFSSQRVALLLRAIAKRPDLVILDEAFSGMDERTRIKCMMFLAYGETTWLRPCEGRELATRQKARTVLDKRGMVKFAGFESRQALLCVSHRKEEVPGLVNQWLYLPEPNSGDSARFGEITYNMRVREQDGPVKGWWNTIWGPQLSAAFEVPERRTYLYDR